MRNTLQENIEYILFDILLEQDMSMGMPGETQSVAKTGNTDNAPESDQKSPFTPAEKKFLGKFDAYGSKHLGIIYSVSDAGIREFIARSGAQLNCNVGILLNLLRNEFIKIVPYTGYGRNTDYTIELQLSLDDVKGFADSDDKKSAETDSAAGVNTNTAAPESPTPAEEPPMEVAWVINYGDILTESTVVAAKLLTENKKSEIHTKKSRIIKQLPKQFIRHLLEIIETFSKKKYTVSDKQRIIADILDNLMVNFDLTPKQIQKSYEMHRNQKRLNSLLDKK